MLFRVFTVRKERDREVIGLLSMLGTPVGYTDGFRLHRVQHTLVFPRIRLVADTCILATQYDLQLQYTPSLF